MNLTSEHESKVTDFWYRFVNCAREKENEDRKKSSLTIVAVEQWTQVYSGYDHPKKTKTF